MVSAFVASPAALSSRTSAFTATTSPLHTQRRLPRTTPRRSFSARRIVRASTEPGTSPDGSAPPTPPTPPREPKQEQTFFGIRLRTNGDVLKFGVVATVVPFGIKALIQAAGVPDLKAGQLTTAFVSVFALVAWVSTYVFRVGTKNMTYAQQLRDYEDQVIQKRYEELTDEELAALQEELKEDE